MILEYDHDHKSHDILGTLFYQALINQSLLDPQHQQSHHF